MQTTTDVFDPADAAFRLYWHDCWCPDFFLHAGFHVDYCPTHGYAWRAQAELGAPLTHCGCDACTESQSSLQEAFNGGTLHHRKGHFVGEHGRLPTLAVRLSLATTARLASNA